MLVKKEIDWEIKFDYNLGYLFLITRTQESSFPKIKNLFRKRFKFGIEIRLPTFILTIYSSMSIEEIFESLASSQK